MKAVESLGRQPKSSGKILRIMIISQAVTETASIFALVIALLLAFQGGDGLSNLINPRLGGLIAMLSMCRVPIN